MSIEKEGTKIPFINVLKFIECGEKANITVNGKNYNVSVNDENEMYYIEEQSFKDRQDFINGLCRKTSIQLSEDSIVILNSIDSVKVDSSWESNDTKQINKIKEPKKKLYRNILLKTIIVYSFIIFIVGMLIKDLVTYKGNALFAICIVVLLIISTINIAFFKGNRTLFKYSKKQINELEEKALRSAKEDVLPSIQYWGYKIIFLERNLIFIKYNNSIEVINYDDIVRILYFDTADISEKEEAIYFLTKNKQCIKFKIKKAHRSKLKKKLLEKNPQIIFEKSKSVKIKHTFIEFFKEYSVIMPVLIIFSVCLARGYNLLLYLESLGPIVTILGIIAFYILGFIAKYFDWDVYMRTG